MIFNETITIYHHYKVDGEDKWQRTLLDNCYIQKEIIKTVGESGIIRIADCMEVTILYREGYRSYDQWTIDAGWTIDPTSNLDLLVIGECDLKIGDDISLKEAKKNNKRLFTVVALVDNTERNKLKHWRVIAK